MRLNEMQRQFRDTLLDSNKEPPEDLAACFMQDNVAGRLEIYRNNILSNTGGSLMNVFPLLEKIVGNEFLRVMVNSYIRQHPPQNGYLFSCAGGFADFVEKFEPAKSMPYLPDMARLETAMHDACHAEDDEALAPSDLDAKDPATMKLQPRHSVRLLESSYPLLAIRELCLQDKAPAPAFNGEKIFLLIHRRHLEAMVTELSESEYAFLNFLKRYNFGEAARRILALHPGFDLALALRRHVQLRVIRK